MRLKNKIAIVTGAGSGIGRAIAQAYFKEGAKVVLADINFSSVNELAQNIGENALAIETDVSKIADIDKMVKFTLEKFKRIDILVNNAGIDIMSNIEDITEEQWEKLIGINLKGAYFCTRRVVPEMMKLGKGKIINISSLAAVVGGPMISLYSTAKGGILGFSKALAVELSTYKINVNCICPGFIETNMTAPYLAVEDIKKDVINRTPLERIGLPDKDIAPAAVYLASDESDFITGQHILIDGGYSVV